MLIDEVNVTIKAGNGGDGKVHFFRNRWTPKGGPDGGDGGRGGSVFFRAVADINKLYQYRAPKIYRAADGGAGGKDKCSGKSGEDLILDVPVGTVASYDNGTSVEFTEVGQLVLMAKGGRGGKGNFHYRSSTNQTPLESQPGEKRVEKYLFLKLKLIAQIGLIGLPNAGKTSLLNELTAAKARVANYAFTTLEPNLGVTYDGYIVADIPGLIEGAAEGKGLGVKFLKHVERTKILIHCISAESDDPVRDYKIVRKELENYSSVLASKPEIILVTKTDTRTPKEINKIKKLLKTDLAVSIIDAESINVLNRVISNTFKLEEAPINKRAVAKAFPREK